MQEFISDWRSGWKNAKPGDIKVYQSVDRFARLISEKGCASIEGAIHDLSGLENGLHVEPGGVHSLRQVHLQGPLVIRAAAHCA